MSTVQDLADIGKIIEDASVAVILLGGLTSRFDPLIMALENSTSTVTSELVKTKLLTEFSRSTVNDEGSSSDAALGTCAFKEK